MSKKKLNTRKIVTEEVATPTLVNTIATDVVVETPKVEEAITVNKVVEKKVEFTPVTPKVVQPLDKMCICVGLKNHTCTIAKQSVVITKGEDHKLSNEVAAILSNAGIVVKR